MDQKIGYLGSFSEYTIPKNLFQTFETYDLAPGMQQARESWKSKNTDWTYRFYDDSERRGFIADHFDKKIVAAYDKLSSGAFRADLWRYCILHECGGAYSDIDAICLVPLHDILQPNDRFVAARAGGVEWGVSNGFIASEPRNAFLAKVIERGARDILAGETDGYLSVGPGALGMAMNAVLHRPLKTSFQPGFYSGYRLFRKEGDAIFNDDIQIISTAYEGYKEDLAKMGIRHWQETVVAPTILQRLRRKLRSLTDLSP